jgi:hypothetical protein
MYGFSRLYTSQGLAAALKASGFAAAAGCDWNIGGSVTVGVEPVGAAALGDVGVPAGVANNGLGVDVGVGAPTCPPTVNI